MIRLNLSTDYALRTLLYLAAHPGRQVSTREVCDFYSISADHVSKVVQHLVHAGYIRAERGRTGGLRLSKERDEIRVGDIVVLFEGPVALLECVNTRDVCIIQPVCRLREVLSAAGSELLARLNQVTLAELVSSNSPVLVQLTGTPPEKSDDPTI